MTPFKVVYGRDPPTLLRYGDTPSANGLVEELLKDKDGLLMELRENLVISVYFACFENPFVITVLYHFSSFVITLHV